MIRRPPRSTRVRSSAASDVYKRQTFHCAQTLHFAPRFVILWTQISSRTAFESSLRLPVSIGAFVKTRANDGPNAQCQPLAHSMRPNLPNISRFQSIAVVQPRARGLYEHFLVSERLFGTFCRPQAMESSVFPRGIAICVQRLGLHYVMGGGWELSIQMSM